MRRLIGFLEHADRGAQLHPTSSRGLPTSTSSHLEATSCVVWFACIIEDVERTSPPFLDSDVSKEVILL